MRFNFQHFLFCFVLGGFDPVLTRQTNNHSLQGATPLPGSKLSKWHHPAGCVSSWWREEDEAPSPEGPVWQEAGCGWEMAGHGPYLPRVSRADPCLTLNPAGRSWEDPPGPCPPSRPKDLAATPAVKKPGGSSVSRVWPPSCRCSLGPSPGYVTT